LTEPAARAVLITRPEPGAAETASRIATFGFVPVVAPVIAIRPVLAELPAPEQVQAILVTSGNAADALPPSYRQLPLLAVGDASAARAGRAGQRVVHSAHGDAKDLAALAARLSDPGGPPLLLASGRGQGAALAAELTRRGFSVLHRVVYEVVPAATLPATAHRALEAGQLCAALFFSADTAGVFVRLVQDAALATRLGDVDALAISAATASALAPLRWRRVRAALQPNQDALLALLI
jgi:uroporphyrinogen-III synthase